MKIGKFRVSKKAVSPVIATLLMIAVAVAASVIVYVWSAGLLGTLMGGGGAQVREQLSIEAYDWSNTGSLVLYVRNVGAASVNVSSVYVGGTASIFSKSPNTPIDPGGTQTLTVTVSGFATGVAYTTKIATSSGGLFSTSVICGAKA